MTKKDNPEGMVRVQDRQRISSQHRLQRWWKHNQWLLIGSAWLVALTLGYTGFARYAASTGEEQTPWDLLYLTLQLIPMNSGAVTGPVGWELNVARLLIPFLAALTAVQAFAALFKQQADLVRLKLIRDHIVICGLSHKGILLTACFRDRGNAVVVIEQNGNNPALEQCRLHGAIVLVGDASDMEILSKVGVSRARALIAVCDDDGVNAEIALNAREMVRGRSGSVLTCIIHIVDPHLYALLREKEIEMEASSAFRLELFNVYSRGAQLLLADLPGFNSVEDGKGQHLVVIGLGMMGESLVANAARTWRQKHARGGKSLRITIVDREATRKCDALSIHYPRLRESCELIACEMEVHSPEFQSGDFILGSQGLAGVDCFCVCLDDDSLSLYTGLVLLQITQSYKIPVFVRVAEIAGLARFFKDDYPSQSPFANLHTFGLHERTCTPDLLLGGTHEILAMAIHEEYLKQQMQSTQKATSEESMSPWEQLPEVLKESNREQADQIHVKLQAVGCRIAPFTDWDAASFEFTTQEIEQMAQMEHENWVKRLQSAGWTFTPNLRNREKKTHPDLVPWAELPEVEKEKNRNTVREIPHFLVRVGFQVERHGST